MVVAAGAANGQSQKCLACDAKHVIKLIVALFFDLTLCDLCGMGAGAKETCQVVGICVCGRKFIPGELPRSELVPRHIGIECADNGISVRPCIWPVIVLFVAMAFCVACDIQPVTRPLFAVVRICEEAVNDTCEGAGFGVGEEGCDFDWSRGDSCDVKCDAPKQCPLVGLRVTREAFGFESCFDGGIDVHGPLCDGQAEEGPVIPATGSDFTRWSRSATFGPLSHQGQFLWRQLSTTWRHRRRTRLVVYRHQQLARTNRAFPAICIVEAQAGGCLWAAVAGIAFCGKERADVLLVKSSSSPVRSRYRCRFRRSRFCLWGSQGHTDGS